MFYDVRRLGGPVAALLAVTAGLVCCGLAMRAALGGSGSWLVLQGQTFNVAMDHKKIFSRILGIKRDLDEGRRPAAGERLGILVGASTLRQGVDPAILERAAPGWRWTNLALGAHAPETDLTVRMIYEVGVKPSAIGVVANTGILVADRDLEDERAWADPGEFVRLLRGRKFELARGELVSLTMVPWRLAFPYRGQVFTLVDRALFRAKLEMLGQGPAAIASPEPDPWLNPYPPDLGGGTPDPSDVGNAKVLRYIGIKGWYDVANYRVDGPSFAALVDLFRLAHEQKARTFLALVPESSPYRARLPDSVADFLKRALEDALGDAAPVFLDFRNSAPDEHFADVNHLNPAGREQLSNQLAEALKPILGN